MQLLNALHNLRQQRVDVLKAGLVAETGCRYFSPTAFPDEIQAGVRVAHLGDSSVRYEIGLFRNNEDEAAAVGYFVHVYVDRETKRPVTVDAKMRGFLEGLKG